MLQWSPTHSGRGNSDSQQVQRHQPEGFNGALPIQVGKHGAWRDSEWEVGRFNGALPIQVGKPTDSWMPSRVPMLLQWSPTHSGRETYTGVKWENRVKLLQWSPTHSGRETWREKWRLPRAGESCFNGALPIQVGETLIVNKYSAISLRASMEPYPFR